jgi:NDP-sugar pyrophosphorylase family protein
MSKITVAILAAGAPKKMKSYGATSLLKVSDSRYLLEDQIAKIKYVYNGAKVVIIVGYENQKITKRVKSRGVDIIVNEDFDNNNSAYSLCKAAKLSDSHNLLAIHGDIYFNIDTLKYISNVHYSEESCILYDTKGQIKANKPGIIMCGYKLEHINYLHKTKWAQIMFFNGREFIALNKIEPGKKYSFEVINEINELEGTSFCCHSPNAMKLIEVESTKDIQSEAFKNIDR